MNILLLTTHLNLGGIGIYVFSLAKGLSKKGHRVSVLSSGGDLVRSLESNQVSHFTLDIKTRSELNPKLAAAFGRIARIIKENDIEIIHAHTRVTQVLAHMLSRKTGIPYVSTCHGFFKKRLFRRIFPCWGHRCIAISEAVREHLVNDFKVKKEAVFVVHNGVETEKFSCTKFTEEQKENFKRELGLRSTAPIIGTIARLSSVKGQQYLILAMKIILQNNQPAQLLLVGDGPEKERLMQQAKELGIEDSVVFCPSTLDSSVPLACMDIFVFPSLLEGLGLAIIEAQAMGVPVVASDVGGVYTLIKDGISGFLVQPKQPDVLAQVILNLLRDKDMAQKVAQAAQVRAQRDFNLDQMISGVEHVYRNAVTQ